MSLAQFSVSRPVTVIMRIVALVLLGIICLTKLPVDLLPNVTMPVISVSTTWPNASPEVVETQVTRPVEEALSSVQGLYEITSTSTEGSSNVRVQFQWGTDIGQAAVDTLQLVERAQQGFPQNTTIQTPLVFKFDPTQIPILTFAVNGIADSVKLRTILDNQVTPILESANGVGSATATGGEQRAIIVDVDPMRLSAHHLALNDVINRLMVENVNLPAGIAKQSETEYTVRSLGWFISPADIANMPLSAPNGQVVLLKDVASVRDEHTETRIYTRLNGQQAAGMLIMKQSAANTISTANAVFAKIKQVQKLYPQLQFHVAYNQATFIQQSINDVAINALLGGVLAILILLFFLRNIQSTLVVALSIPTSIISTFALLYLCGYTLNTMSMGGLALATGLIVDDAVVVLENIFRHIERDKKTAREAAVSATDEILSAVVSSTWTVMVVFLPLLLIKGQSGQMFAQFAVVVIFSLAVSLLDATTVVPMLASRLISGAAHAESLRAGDHQNWLQRQFTVFGHWFDALDNSYREMLSWAIRHRAMVIIGALTITGLSCLLYVFHQIGTEMLPQTDSGNISVSVKLPVGTSLSRTDMVMKQVEKIVDTNPDVETAFATSGSENSFRGTSIAAIQNQGSVNVLLKDKRKHATAQVVETLRQQMSVIAGVRPQVNSQDLVSMLMTGGNNNIEVDIFGQNLNTLSSLANQLMTRVRTIPGYENVDVNWQDAEPEIQWQVDRVKSAQLGVSYSDIANTLETATNGDTATYYQENGYQYPIIVQVPTAQRKSASEMANLIVNPSGANAGSHPVLLSQVATPIYTLGPNEITRLGRQRYIAVTGTPTNRSPGDVQRDIEKSLGGLQMPSGYYWDWGINQKRQGEEFGGLGLAIFMAIALIYILLASQFESLVYPLVVLCSVPLAITGVLLGLFLTGRSFGLTAFIGSLMLIGIVVKNGILLVDYTNHLRKAGMERTAAILRAGPTRLRPILMTACAACLGMLPIAAGLGKGDEIQAPMATAVIGGLITSTMLTLLVVPVVYLVFDDLTISLYKLFHRTPRTQLLPGDATALEIEGKE
jgi:HAE1 family hydrophobic/amphiphilic exporter-1